MFDFLHHRIGSTHVVHHIDCTIPHYHALEATKAVCAHLLLCPTQPRPCDSAPASLKAPIASFYPPPRLTPFACPLAVPRLPNITPLPITTLIPSAP